MEIGSFLELQFPKGKEYYAQKENIARLNSGRAAIWHAFRVLEADVIWLPYYQCDSVRDFLIRKNVPIRYYHIDQIFDPIDLNPAENDAVLFVNYYGIMSAARMRQLAAGYNKAIIDNSQAFFCQPIEGCMNVYSCRKFVGVPDGAYVIGDHAKRYMDEYAQCYSSDTAAFMLLRIEYGCEGKAYQSRTVNENRLESEDAMKMSRLTQTILDGTDYDVIISKRRENFETACSLFDAINRIEPKHYYDTSCVPMVYPLVVERDDLLDVLQQNKHFQGHWWSYICNETPEDVFEHWLSRYMIPITIDQRYGETELYQINRLVKG